MGVQREQVYTVKLLGREGATAVAFPPFVTMIICIEHRRLTKEALDSKQKVDEGSSMSKNQKVGDVFAGGTEVQLLQSDIRQFSRKKILKTKEVRSVAMAMVKELNLTTSCREKKSPKEGYIYIKIQRGQ